MKLVRNVCPLIKRKQNQKQYAVFREHSNNSSVVISVTYHNVDDCLSWLQGSIRTTYTLQFQSLFSLGVAAAVQITFYCTAEHQSAHWPSHRGFWWERSQFVCNERASFCVPNQIVISRRVLEQAANLVNHRVIVFRSFHKHPPASVGSRNSTIVVANR